MRDEQQRPKRRLGGYTISAVAEQYGIHPQTLRLYEREGLLKPSRSSGNTRYYSDEDLERLETILALTRDMGVNLAGVEIILNLREQFARMQDEMTQFLQAVQSELSQRLSERGRQNTVALVPRIPSMTVRGSVTRFGVRVSATGSETPKQRAKRKKIETEGE